MKPQVYHVDAFTSVPFAAIQRVWCYMLMD
jgi:hypothetical protein